jgi:phosphate transport system permease protein
MIWLAVLLLALFSAAAFLLGRRRAVAIAQQAASPAYSRPAHSRPGHHGVYAALWTAGPALILLAAAAALAPLAGLAVAPVLSVTLALAVALLGLLFALRRIGADFRARVKVERAFQVLLVVSSAAAVMTMAAIVLSLAAESLRFFTLAPPWRFLTGMVWNPEIGAFGAAPLFFGTLAVAAIALLVAGPLGLMAAVYLAEYASPRTRRTLKPALEMLAGVPGVVWGLFAVLSLGPVLAWALNDIGPAVGQVSAATRMILTAGVAIGMMLLPFVAALSDDVLRAIPPGLRYASYASGATKAETILRIVLPAAWPGVGAAMLLALGRALGETMIVTMAAGAAARLTPDAPAASATVTAQIVDLLHWDQDFDRPTTLAAYGLGLTLFLVTLGVNFAAQKIVRAYGERHV